MSKKTTQFLLVALSLMFMGILQAACTAHLNLASPSSQFTDNGDGTVTDNVSNLTWMRCNLGETWSGVDCSVGAASTLNWQDALTQADSNSQYGQTDWRLPNLNELTSITEKACYEPAINEAIFPSTISNFYWTSSPYALESGFAWTVNFGRSSVYIGSGSGGADSGTNSNSGDMVTSLYNVRLVRGG